MKRLILLCPALVLILLVQAQDSSKPTPANWSSPFIHNNLMQNFANQHVKAIYSNSDGVSAMRGGGTVRYEESKSYFFDEKGQLTTVVELEGQDTARVITYSYTTNGSKNWETIEDKSWNKVYKSGYRFNGNKNIYQVKSYEMINDHDAMLLQTANYVYDDKGRLESIRYMEHHHMVKRRDFTYDHQNRLDGEFEYDDREDLLESVVYTYDSRGRCTRIVNTNNVEESHHIYRYVYDMYDKLIEASWEENKKLKGRALYVYNAGGRILEMQTEMGPNAKGNKVHTVFGYDYHRKANSSMRLSAARK